MVIILIILIGILLLIGVSYGGAWLGFPEAQNLVNGWELMWNDPEIGFVSIAGIIVAICVLLFVVLPIFGILVQHGSKSELQRQAKQHFDIDLSYNMSVWDMEQTLEDLKRK